MSPLQNLSREEWEKFSDLSLDMLCVAGFDGFLKFVNHAWERTLGWTADELVAKPWLAFVHPDDRESTTDAGAKLLAGRLVPAFPNRYRCKDGTYRWLLWNATPDQEARLIYAVARDVTEERRTLEALETSHAELERRVAERTMELQEREERFRALFDAAPDAFVLVGEGGKILLVNTEAERMFGYQHGELVGQTIERLLPPGARAAHARHRGGFFANPRTRRMGESTAELKAQHKDGSEFPIDISLGPFSFMRQPAVLSIVRDISDRRKLEQSLRRTEDQLRQAQKLEAVGRLAGGVAHDFNNILSVILSYSGMIIGDLKPGDPLRVDIEEIRKAGERAGELTRQLLAFSRQQMLQPRILDVNQVLVGMERMLRRLLGEDVELSLLTSHRVGHIHADPGQIEQIVMNLVVNARDAMPDRGKVAIETENTELDEAYAARHLGVVPGGYVMLAVTDTGTGMDKATLERIFEPFFTTKESGKGTGLGLATVFGIVKQSGGHIWVYSEPGKGTTFKIYFPRRSELTTEASSVPPTPMSLDGTETILLVEDEEQVRIIMRAVLRRRGYNVLDAQNGGEAFLICEKFSARIDLLLTDVVLPRMSGRELADRLGPMRPDMKVLFVSGYTRNAVVHHGVLDSGVSFLQKPITPEALLRKVREVLDLIRAPARTP